MTVDALTRDIRFGLRALAGSPAFTLVAVLTLGCGIGATTAAFTEVYAVFLKPLAVREPQQLRALSYSDPRRPRAVLNFASADYRHLRESTATFSDLACWTASDAMQPLGERGPIRLQFVSANYFRLLGVAAVLGRGFDAGDDRAGAPPVVILSDAAWRRDFAADPDVVGRTLRVQRQAFSIVGVLPRGFFGVSPDSPHDVFVPHALAPLVRPGNPSCQVFGRLRSGVTTAQAQAEIARRFRDSPAAPSDPPRAGIRLTLSAIEPGGGPAGLRERTGPSLAVLMGISTLVLLIACANTAGLLLVRGAARTREVGTRVALGATRGRILGERLIECMLLSVAGGLLGVAVAYAVEPMVPRFVSELGGVATLTGEPRWLGIDVTPDARVLGFSLLVTMATVLLCGAVPALRASRVDTIAMLRQPSLPSSRRIGGVGAAFVAMQVAISMLLLVGVGLFTRTVVMLDAVPIGYQPDGMLFATINPIDRPFAFVADAMRTVGAIPGVQVVAASQWPIFNNAEPKLPVCIPGDPPQRHALDIEWATPRFFETWGVRLVAGRDFASGRRGEAIVNQRLAAALFPRQRVLGQTIGFGECPGRPFTIIGVVADHLDRPRVEVLPMVYLQYPTTGTFNPTTIALRVAGDPRAFVPQVRRVISRLDSALTDGDVTTGVDYRNAQTRRESLLASLLAGVGGVALLMSCIGIYGTVAYAVTRRTRELGIRTALGAQRGHIIRTVFSRYGVAAAIGIAFGAAAAVGAARFLGALLFRASRLDGWSIAGAVACIAIAAAVAAARPALRAIRINPIESLRCE
jgi:predicted permease